MFESQQQIIYKKWTESKVMVTQLISTITGLFGIYGQDMLNSLNSNLEFLKTNVSPKYFITVSIACAVLTAYFKAKEKATVIVSAKKLEAMQEAEQSKGAN